MLLTPTLRMEKALTCLGVLNSQEIQALASGVIVIIAITVLLRILLIITGIILTIHDIRIVQESTICAAGNLRIEG